MPFDWKLALLDQIKALLPSTTLQDSQVPVSLAKAKVDQPITFGLEQLTFVVDGGAEVCIEAFNAPGDVDADGVLGTAPAKEDVTKLSPPLVLGQDGWLKYAVRARAKVQAGAELPFLSASGSGEGSLFVADYHVHALTDRVQDAVINDVQHLRLPMVLDHVLKLQPKEALAFQARTRLETSVTLKWADVFTSNLNALSRLLPAGTLVGIQTSAGASVSGSITVTDDFLLTFSREKAGAVVVSVQKGVVREPKLAAQVGVSVELADAQVVGAALDALVGLPGLAQFEALVNKLSTTQLNDVEKRALRLALDRLGLQGYEADATALKRAWEDRKTQVKQALTNMAAGKISAGFQYEYSRLSEEQTLLRMELPDEQLKKFHTSLVLGRLSRVLPQVDPGALRSYFEQDSRTLNEAWGFSLGFSKWELLHSQTQMKLQRVAQFGSPDHIHGPRRYAYVGVRSYEGGFFKDRGGWSVDFKCDMAEFKSEPTVRDFNYGLYMLLRRNGKLSEESLRQAIDEAIVWHVLDDADEDRVLQQIKDAARGGEVEVRLELKLADALFRELTSLMAFGQPEFFAKALARAMPWDTLSARANPEFRQGVYAPLWMAYLTEKAKDWTPQRAAQRAAAWLKQDRIAKGQDGQVAFWEGTGGANTFADVLDKNSRLADVSGMYGGTYVRWQRVVAGMAQLKDGLLQGGDPTLIDNVFSELEELWRVSFHVKAFGAMLLDLSTKSIQGLKAVERTFTVVTGTSPQQAQIVFSSSREG